MTIVVQVASTATSILYNTDILNSVCPDVPMAPVALVTSAIREAVIDLCERALIWRQELQQILVLPPTSTTTTAAQALGDTQVSVADATNFNNGDTITVQLNNTGDPGAGTKWRGHVSGTPIANVITLDGALPDVVNVGATVTKLVYLYPITVPAGAAFVKGISAWLNDAPIDPIPQDDLDNEFNNTSFGWVGVNWRTDVNLPTRYYFPDDTTVGLLMPPNQAGNLRINAALKPTRSSTTFPTWIFERYLNAIAHGAKSKLMLKPKLPYSNHELGTWHADKFNEFVSEARVRAARASSRGPLRSHTVYGLR